METLNALLEENPGPSGIQDENEHTIANKEGNDIPEVPEIIPPTTSIHGNADGWATSHG